MSLKGKVALITGGARGLGKGFAEAILAEGGQVALVDYDKEGTVTQNALTLLYGVGSCLFLQCDVTNAQQLEYVFAKTKAVFGNLDIVVNNAGIGSSKDFQKTIDINLGAVIRGSFLALDYMSKAKGGRGGVIINIGSTAGLTAIPLQPVYGATKHGVVGFTRCLGVDLDLSPELGVSVRCLCPSFTQTRLLDAKYFEEGEGKKLTEMMGVMKVPQVVEGFMQLLTTEGVNGGVLSVTPKGMSYKYPRRLASTPISNSKL